MAPYPGQRSRPRCAAARPIWPGRPLGGEAGCRVSGSKRRSRTAATPRAQRVPPARPSITGRHPLRRPARPRRAGKRCRPTRTPKQFGDAADQHEGEHPGAQCHLHGYPSGADAGGWQAQVGGRAGSLARGSAEGNGRLNPGLPGTRGGGLS